MFLVRSRTALVTLLLLLILTFFLSISYLPSYAPAIRSQLPTWAEKFSPSHHKSISEALNDVPKEAFGRPAYQPAKPKTPSKLSPEVIHSKPQPAPELTVPGVGGDQEPTLKAVPEHTLDNPFASKTEEDDDYELDEDDWDDLDDAFAEAFDDEHPGPLPSAVVMPADPKPPADADTSNGPAPEIIAGQSPKKAPVHALTDSIAPAKWEERYVFAFGDSLTSTGFDIFGAKPTKNNPFGNPPFPGHSSSVGPNWIDDMIVASPPNTLCYNFAAGAAVVDITIVRPMLSLIPFPYQVRNFTRYLATTPHPTWAPWNSNNSIAIVFLGTNDVTAMQVYTDHATPQSLTDKIMDSYFEKIGSLYKRGLRRFAFMGVPPLYRFPYAISPEPYEHHANLTTSCVYWNMKLAERTVAFKQEHPDVIADVVLTDQYFNTAINDYSRYGALNQTCESKDGMTCLWVDGIHPGVQIAQLMGKGMYDHLLTSGFYGGDGVRANHSDWHHT